MTQEPRLPTAVRLAARSPVEVNNLLASSVRQCGVELREVIDSRGGAELADGSRTPTVYTRRFEVADGTEDQLAAARAKVQQGLTPPTRDQVESWLVELSVITARRQDDDSTEALRLAAYASRLADYPADVARHALLTHRWKFFPAWAEVAEVCDAQMSERRRMLSEIERAEREAREAALRARALPDEEMVTMTPEEAAARRAEINREIAEGVAKLKAAAKVQADRDQEVYDAIAARMWKPGPDPVGLGAQE